MVDRDRFYMERALFHAARGQGRTTPNPMVGAVVVDPAGVVVGHGWHERAGEPHAEVNAIVNAGGEVRGGTMFVTLEPCCHAGRTGPCTRRIIAAGIRRVVAAMRDPDPRVSGRGFEDLRAAGVELSVGLCEVEARRLNAAFIRTRIHRRPLVVLKAATSLDGRIGVRGGRTYLSSPESNRKTQQLRAAADAIAVGSGTVLVDDPILTCRETGRIRPLARVVFDRQLRTPVNARLFSTTGSGPVIIITGPDARARIPERVLRLEGAGAAVRTAADLGDAMRALLEWEISTLLVEGGAELHAAFWQAGLVDRVHLVVSPHVLGADAVPLFNGLRVPRAILNIVTAEPRGADMWIEADVYRNH